MEDRTSTGLLFLWAKLARDLPAPPSYHPLLCHLLDVAAVSGTLWRDVLSPRAREWFAQALELDQETAGRWIAFLAGVHDLGKASPGFQLQDATPQALRSQLVASGLRREALLSKPPAHGLVTAWVLPRVLEAEFGLSPAVAARLGTVVGGHHGILPRSEDLNRLTLPVIGAGLWEAVRSRLVQALADHVGLPRAAPPRRLPNAVALALAGLVSVADWIGSVEDLFRYAVSNGASAPSPNLLETYPRRAERRAAAALERLGWTALPDPGAPRSFAALFPRIASPRPLQETAVRLAGRLSPPFLAVVEAPTGEGKTEAAIYLADHAAAAHHQCGLYFALPTQATSNQMFSRVRDFLGQRYPNARVNLQLLHGHAALSAEFEMLRQRADLLLQPGGLAQDPGADPDELAVVAAGWFTHRKRGLLAPFGVGTVDQALLAVLQTRHGFVRLWGLANKVVVVDEVHAYDAYMTTLIERLLEWLAALGSSVVLLSATLPHGRQRRLIAAYARGLGRSAPTLTPRRYPRLAWLTRDAADVEPLETSAHNVRTVRVEWVDGAVPEDPDAPFPLGERLRETLADGGCAAVVCSTVARAQAVYRRLRPYFGRVLEGDRFAPEVADDGLPVLDLFHARFLFHERDAREKRALLRFGKAGTTVQMAEGEERPVRRPRRAVLVATQVVEQSLDLDFDLLVTDLAPVDLILQRVGRLHRHQQSRPEALARPTVWIGRPDVDADGTPRFGRGDEWIYDRHVLLRSWLALRDREALRVPEDVEALVEAVYDDSPCPTDLPAGLQARWEETRNQLDDAVEAEQREAHVRWIRRPASGDALWHFTENPREDEAPEFHQAHQALTRLAEPMVGVVCLYGSVERPTFDRDGLHPVPVGTPDLDLARRLLERSVQISDRRVVFTLREQTPPPAWQKSALLRHHRLVVLDQAGRAPVGRFWLRLHPELGIVVDARKED